MTLQSMRNNLKKRGYDAELITLVDFNGKKTAGLIHHAKRPETVRNGPLAGAFSGG